MQPQLCCAIDHVSVVVQGIKKPENLLKTPLCEHTSKENVFKYLKLTEMFQRKENFRLKVDPDSGSPGIFRMPVSFSRHLNSSKEMAPQAANYTSIANVMFSAIIHSLVPEDKRSLLLKEHITIAAEASTGMWSIATVVSVGRKPAAGLQGWSVGSPEVKSIQCNQGAVSIRKTVLPGMAIPMLKIRRPNGRLIFNMEIAIRR